MYWVFNFIVGLTIVTGQQDCLNAVFNDCKFPAVYTAIHADGIDTCAAICDVYALSGTCSMYTFEAEELIGENCKIYDMQTTIPDFQAACNEVGVPVNDECVFYDDECTVTNLCPTCISCGTGTCGGYMQMDCEFQGEIMERHPGVTFDTCQLLCRIEKAAYINYYRESNDCHCMATDERVCKKQVVQYGTDINVCNPENKVSCANEEWTEDPSSGLCYHISSEELSWSDAHAACLSMSDSYYNSDLASIHSATEMEFIKNLLPSDKKHFWAGLNDIQKEGSYIWTDGSSVTYTDWHYGEPNNANGGKEEDCIEMPYSYDFEWNDTVCTISEYFVCKKTGIDYMTKETEQDN